MHVKVLRGMGRRERGLVRRVACGSSHVLRKFAYFTICVLNGGVMKPFLISTALSIPLISNALSATSFIASRSAASSAVSCRETTCGV